MQYSINYVSLRITFNCSRLLILTSIISFSFWSWFILLLAYSALLSASLEATPRPNCFISFRCRSASYPDTKIGEDLPESPGGGSFSFICQRYNVKSCLNLHCYNLSLVISFYTDTSVLLENSLLLKILGNYIRDSSGVFFIFSPARKLMTSFPAFSTTIY